MAFDGADRVRSIVAASAAASGGQAGLPSFNFSNLLTDLHLQVLSFDSSSEYPFSCFAEGILTKVAGLGILCTRINMALLSFRRHLLARKMLSGEVRDVV